MRRIRILLFATLAVLATVRAASPLTTTVVLGHSMEPTMRPGGLYVLDRGYYRSHPVTHGDVIVLRHGSETYVKRVYALPGDRVSLIRYSDGSTELLDSEHAALLREAQRFGVLPDGRLVTPRVPPGHYFVLGDNVLNSTDSRDFGPVPHSAIMGRVWQ